MENDTSINRISSSDSNTSVLRKKSTAEKIDISRLSFFDELLSIGQFESSLQEAVGLPIKQSTPSDCGPENKSVDETSNEADSGEQEASTDSTTEQSASSVFASTQQHLPSQPQSHGQERKSDKQRRNQSVESESANKNSGPDIKSTLTSANVPSANVPSAPDLLGSSVDAKASAGADFLNVKSELNQTDGDGKPQPVGNTGDSSPSKPILKSKASSNKHEGKADQGKSPESNLNLNPKSLPADAKVKPTFSHSPVKQSDGHGNTDNSDATSAQPRNRRAERLSQRSSENDHTLDDSDSSSASAQAIESVGPLATSEIPPQESILSVTSSVNSLAPIVNSSPLIAPLVSISTNLTSTTANAQPSVEGISAVVTTSTRGGIQTNMNATFSGATSVTSNPARTEQVGSEVARSNPGSRISAYQEVKLVQRVLRGVEQLANGGGQVRLRLHPPELGSLQMSLRMEAGQVFAKLEVENSKARDALLNNIQTLRDRLAEQGMQVASFEVEVSTDSSGSGTSSSNFQKDGGTESQSRWDHATSRFAQQNDNRLLSEPTQPERKSGAAWTRTNSSLDLTV